MLIYSSSKTHINAPMMNLFNADHKNLQWSHTCTEWVKEQHPCITESKKATMQRFLERPQNWGYVWNRMLLY